MPISASKFVRNGGPYALLLNGAGNYLIYDRPLLPDGGDFTISVTFCAGPPGPGYAELVSQPSSMPFYLGRTPQGTVRVSDAWGDTTAPFPTDGAWHRLTVVRDSASTVLYLDGVEAKRLQRPITIPANINEFRIGRQYGNWEEYFHGAIAEVVVFGRAQSADEVRSYVSGSLSGREPGVCTLLRFDEGDKTERVRGSLPRLSEAGCGPAPAPANQSPPNVDPSTLPPSVTEVPTDLPAFIGYTGKRPGAAGTTGPVVARVSTMLEYEQLFGGAKAMPYLVRCDPMKNVREVLRNPPKDNGTAGPEFLLYYALRHFFENGGGTCYVVSIGTYADRIDKAHIAAGLDLIARQDEPTLLVLIDAVNLALPADYHAMCRAALAQCQTRNDRFALFDVRQDLASPDFRAEIAAFRQGIGAESLQYGAAYYPYLETTLSYAYDEANVTVEMTAGARKDLAQLKTEDAALYGKIKTLLAEQRVVLPPSAAAAGICARTDRERGVWKAPANIAIAAVRRPIVVIDNAAQDEMNLDESRRPINALRSLAGKGTLITGARTLAGSRDEWRYISVRRLFLMIEESARKSTAFVASEPNDVTTWLKVRSMLNDFLYKLMERGALAGGAQDQSYFVNVGLGQSMTAEDVQAGRLIIEMGVAAIRPAEFTLIRIIQRAQKG